MTYVLIVIGISVLILVYSLFLLSSSVRIEDDDIILNFYKLGYLTYIENKKQGNKFKEKLAKLILIICFKIRKSSKIN